MARSAPRGHRVQGQGRIPKDWQVPRIPPELRQGRGRFVPRPGKRKDGRRITTGPPMGPDAALAAGSITGCRSSSARSSRWARGRSTRSSIPGVPSAEHWPNGDPIGHGAGPDGLAAGASRERVAEPAGAQEAARRAPGLHPRRRRRVLVHGRGPARGGRQRPAPGASYFSGVPDGTCPLYPALRRRPGGVDLTLRGLRRGRDKPPSPLARRSRTLSGLGRHGPTNRRPPPPGNRPAHHAVKSGKSAADGSFPQGNQSLAGHGPGPASLLWVLVQTLWGAGNEEAAPASNRDSSRSSRTSR